MFDFANHGETMTHFTSKGAFLVSGKEPNVMTISWGMAGVLWGKKVLLIPVRESRYTKGFIDETGELTVSVPYGTMADELKYCGTKSGRDVDKFETLGLVKVKGDVVDTYYVGGCDKHYECKVLAKLPLSADMLPDSVNATAYKTGDYHTLYIAEVVAE